MPLSVKCSLLVSTYNRPDALAIVLESIRRQTRVPDEVVIADDGSRDDTRELIDACRKSFPCPLIHVWQEDAGFRKCIIWNKALERVAGEYIVQIDGDCVLSPRFVEDHQIFARKGWFTCGSRVLLTKEATEKLLAGGQENFPVLSAFSRGVRNRTNALRIPFLARFFRERYHARKPYIARGCNMSFWKKDLIAVNGYNEKICGWGSEDAELEVRLMKYGVRRQTLKFAGVQFHLFHRDFDRSNELKNIETLKDVLAKPDFWTPDGIVKSPHPPAQI
ncbi:MAG: glycosyltransferase family 2 protein [Opitutae bacterium]|nr:glycosyltransferase family 2 protein [Opitutae bacterium]